MFLEIEEIEVIQFRGFQLNNIKNFKMRLDAKITVLLGRNGCGKSMLVKILPPLCPNKKFFKEGGMRRLVVNSTKGRYELKNTRTGSGWKNDITNLDSGEQVIVGANPTVFDDMVAELFNYTKELNQLLMGQVRLTKMSTPERKKWFSILSESDLTFALKFYTQARKRQRSLSGAIDVIREEIGDLKLKVLDSDEEFAAVEQRRNDLAKELATIDNELIGVENNSEINEFTVEQQIKEIEDINRRIMALNPYIPADLYDISFQELGDRAIQAKTKLDIYTSELEEIVKKLEAMAKLDTVDVSLVEERLKTAETERDSLLGRITLLNDMVGRPELEDDLIGALQWHGMYSSKLVDLLTQFSIAGFVYESEMSLNNLGDSWYKYTTEYNELLGKNHSLKVVISGLTGRLDHIDSCQVVECDSCGNQFKPGVGRNDEQKYREQLAKAIEVEKLQSERLAKVAAIIKKYEELQQTSEGIRGLTKAFYSNEALAALNSLLEQADVYNGMGSVAQPWIDGWKEDVLSLIQYNRTLRTIEKIKTDRAIIMAAKGQDTSELAAKQVELDNAIHALNSELRELSHTQARLEETMSVQQTLETLGESLMGNHEKLTKYLYTTTENARFEIMMSHRSDVSSVLNEVQKRMEEMVGQRKRLADLEEQLDRTIHKHTHAGLIVKAMSPDEGVLAKHLYKCINTITELMTAYINSMWGYEMRILPCAIKNGELDYQFGMWAGTAENAVDDVSEGSLAQTEVIDYVFMLTVYKAMKLDRYPLFLDELGSAFDEGHGDEMINFIKSSLAKGNHSQAIMISHDAATHFQLTNADMVVLDPKGITLPSTYNKFVEMR